MMPDAAGSPPHKLFCCGAVEACPGASSRCIVSTRHHPQIPGPRGIGDMVCCRLGLDHPVIAAVIFRGDKLCVCTGDGLSAGVVQTGKLYRIVGSPGASLRQGSHVVPGAADPLLDGELHSGKSLAGDRVHLLQLEGGGRVGGGCGESNRTRFPRSGTVFYRDGVLIAATGCCQVLKVILTVLCCVGSAVCRNIYPFPQCRERNLHCNSGRGSSSRGRRHRCSGRITGLRSHRPAGCILCRQGIGCNPIVPGGCRRGLLGQSYGCRCGF